MTTQQMDELDAVEGTPKGFMIEGIPFSKDGAPGIMTKCGECGAYVHSAEAHAMFHARLEAIPGPKSDVIEVDMFETMDMNVKYGIEFADEAADDYEFDTLPEALDKFKEFEVDRAKALRKGQEDDWEGMRLMVRRHIVAKGPWEPYHHGSVLVAEGTEQ